MTFGREIRTYDYVNRPYEAIDLILRNDALRVMQAATKAAADKTDAAAAELRVEVAGLKVSTAIAIVIKDQRRDPGVDGSSSRTVVDLEWQAVDHPGIFPLMRAQLAVYPLTSTETQLDLSGVYEPPLGVLGSTLDALVGRRFAEKAVHTFLREIAQYLRTTG